MVKKRQEYRKRRRGKEIIGVTIRINSQEMRTIILLTHI